MWYVLLRSYEDKNAIFWHLTLYGPVVIASSTELIPSNQRELDALPVSTRPETDRKRDLCVEGIHMEKDLIVEKSHSR